jgi:acyl-CoA thioester hydrolase
LWNCRRAGRAGKGAEIIETVQIRWVDVDMFGHVHHVAQVALLEHARTRALDALLGEGATWDYAIVHLALDFRGQLVYRDATAICTIEPTSIGRSSVRLAERVARRDGMVVAEAEAVIVPWERLGNGSRPLSAHERQVLLRAGARDGGLREARHTGPCVLRSPRPNTADRGKIASNGLD